MKATISIIDDNEVVCRILESYLIGQYDVKYFTSVKDFYTDERNSDLIITDIVMPDYDGLELLMEIRRSSTSQKILVISGHNGFLKPSLYLGANETIEKPIKKEVLLSRVSKIIESNSG